MSEQSPPRTKVRGPVHLCPNTLGVTILGSWCDRIRGQSESAKIADSFPAPVPRDPYV